MNLGPQATMDYLKDTLIEDNSTYDLYEDDK